MNSEESPATCISIFVQTSGETPPASGMDPALPLPLQFPSITMDETEVRKAVLSFPAGSSGGPDGLRPQHLRDLLQCRESSGLFVGPHGFC